MESHDDGGNNSSGTPANLSAIHFGVDEGEPDYRGGKFPRASITGAERSGPSSTFQTVAGVGIPQEPQPQQSAPSHDIQPPNPQEYHPPLRQSAPNPGAATPQSFHRRIRRVPPYIDRHESQHPVYGPALLPLGPYYITELKLAMFKDEVLNKFILKSILEAVTRDKKHWFELFYGHTLESINEIKGYYDEGVTEGIEFIAGPRLTGNNTIEIIKRESVFDPLALTILCDACYIVSYIENLFEVRRMIFDHLGTVAAILIVQDLYKIENQLPFQIIKLVLDLRFGKTKGDEIVCKYLSFDCFLNHHQLQGLPWEDDPEHQPLHLLEAYRATLLKSQLANEADGSGTKSHFLTNLFKRGKIWRTLCSRDIHGTDLDDLVDSPFRSLTYLQEKGVYVESNSSYSLSDITFTSNLCYGILRLPTLFVDDNTKVLFSNLIAFEMSAGIQTDYSITCYVNFMKSLIESTEDVKKLQEKRILRSHLGNDDEIVKTFKEISTHGINNFGIFVDVKRGIDKHCNSKAKTWMSELAHKYFRSPWTAIALVGATLMFCFTFLQVYFILNPPHHSH